MSLGGSTLLGPQTSARGLKIPLRSAKEQGAVAAAAKFLAPFRAAEFQKLLGNDAAAQRFKVELDCLARETNPTVLHHSLFTFAQRLQEEEKIPAALEVFRWLSSEEMNPGLAAPLRERATRGMNAILGVGRWQDRAGFLLSRGGDQTLAPEMLLGMIGGGAVGKLAYATLFSRLAASPTIMGLGKWAVQGMAAAGALAIEAPAFTALTKGAGELFGRPSSWQFEAFATETYAAGIFLGAMKFSHFLGSKAFAAPLTGRLDRFTEISKIVFPQVSTYAGIVLAHQAQKKLGLKIPLNDDTLWADSAVELLSFAVAGHLTRRLSGPGHQAWLMEAEARAELTAAQTPKLKWGNLLPELDGLAVDGPAWGPVIMEMRGESDGPAKPPFPDLPGRPREKIEIHSSLEFAQGPYLNAAQVAQLQPIAMQIHSHRQRGLSLARLAAHLHRSGETAPANHLFGESLKVLELLPDLDAQKGTALSQWALFRSETGGRVQAVPIFAKAARIAESLKNEFLKSRDVQDAEECLALLFAISGDLNAASLTDKAVRVQEWAQTLFSRFPEKTFPESLGREQVLDLARRGHWEAAHELAKKLPDPEGYGQAYLELGILAARRGELSVAFEAVAMLQDALDCDPLNRSLAEELARRGQWEEAEFHLQSIRGDAEALEANLVLMRRYPEFARRDSIVGQVENRLLSLLGVLSQAKQAKLRAMFANQAMLKGDMENFWIYHNVAHEILSQLHGKTRSEHEIETVYELIFGLNHLREYERANQWTAWLPTEKLVPALGEIATIYADSGHFTQAEAWVKFIPQEHRAPALKALAILLAERGEGEKALKLANGIGEARQRFDTLEEILLLAARSETSAPAASPP